ncbi:MAG: hypothetical protein PUG12_05725 [Prevotella sp.]|nr:hypothetical protein [Prevotella sp.]
MKTKTKVTTLLILSAMATPFVSCGRSEKAPEEKTPAPAKPVVMDVTSGTKAPATVPIDTIPGQTRLKVTCRCLATSQPEMLDLMPRDVRSARRDTALLGSINRGEVFVVQPGESGYILQKSDNKLLLRFPDKIAWVMASDTK